MKLSKFLAIYKERSEINSTFEEDIISDLARGDISPSPEEIEEEDLEFEFWGDLENEKCWKISDRIYLSKCNGSFTVQGA